MLQRSLSMLALTLTLAACATVDGDFADPTPMPSKPVTATGPSVTTGIETYMQQRARVESAGFRLRKAAAPECREQNKLRADLGLVVWSLANFPNPEDQSHLRQRYDLSDAVTVAIATAQGPSHKAGLVQGDIIVEMNGEPIRNGSGATEHFISTSNKAAKQGPVTIKLASGKSIRIEPEAVCEYPALLVNSPEINAAADGTTFAITTSLFERLQSDDELALVLSHELAHNTLGHLQTSTTTANKPGRLLDALLKSTASSAIASSTPSFSPDKESAADYTGLYFMARAGFNIKAADTLWPRLIQSSKTSLLSKTHPTGPARLAALKRASQEINAKRAAGQDLTPHQ